MQHEDAKELVKEKFMDTLALSSHGLGRWDVELLTDSLSPEEKK